MYGQVYKKLVVSVKKTHFMHFILKHSRVNLIIFKGKMMDRFLYPYRALYNPDWLGKYYRYVKRNYCDSFSHGNVCI